MSSSFFPHIYFFLTKAPYKNNYSKLISTSLSWNFNKLPLITPPQSSIFLSSCYTKPCSQTMLLSLKGLSLILLYSHLNIHMHGVMYVWIYVHTQTPKCNKYMQQLRKNVFIFRHEEPIRSNLSRKPITATLYGFYTWAENRGNIHRVAERTLFLSGFFLRNTWFVQYYLVGEENVGPKKKLFSTYLFILLPFSIYCLLLQQKLSFSCSPTKKKNIIYIL